MPDAADLSTPLAWAQAYARIGWHVLPLEPGQKQPLGRLVPRGMLDASNDPEVIRRWWATAPKAGIGIALAQSGLVAVDVDPRNGGTETFEQLQATHGSLRSEVMAYTGGGGEHHVFVIPPGAHISLPGTLGPGIDLKANGYIVVEPSVHPSGKAYGWEASSSPLDGVAPSPLPDWLRSLRIPLKTAQPIEGAVPVNPQQAKDVREALYVLNADDYHEWVQAGMALHSTGWGHPAYAMWCAWSQQSQKFDATVCRQKWDSFTLPEMRGARGVTLAWVFGEAQSRGWVNPAASVVRIGAGQPLQAEETAPAGGIPYMSLADLESASAAVTWSVKHIIPADSIGMMFGGSGTFKSFLALDYALHVAHGLRWMGFKTRQAEVLYIAAEGGTGLWRRIKAWHQMHGLNWQDAPFHVVPVAVSLLHDAPKVVQAATAAGSAPGVVIVDTLSQTYDGEENSANEMAAYLRALGAGFREVWRCVVLVIHHSGHAATERPRGSSAIRSNVDFLVGVFRDENEMLATLTWSKQKDGELPEESTFSLHKQTVGSDEDGEPITSLAATWLSGKDEVQAARQVEMISGRSGRNGQLLGLVQNGMPEKELRKAFYDVLETTDPHARKTAFYRARDWAVKSGFIEIAQGTVIVLKEI